MRRSSALIIPFGKGSLVRVLLSSRKLFEIALIQFSDCLHYPCSIFKLKIEPKTFKILRQKHNYLATFIFLYLSDKTAL